jgi:hypothetical protein
MVKGFLSSTAIEKAQAHAFFIYNLSLETLEDACNGRAYLAAIQFQLG